MHLELAFEAAFRAGAKPVPVEIVDGVLSRAIDDLEPRLIRNGYDAATLARVRRQAGRNPDLSGRHPGSGTDPRADRPDACRRRAAVTVRGHDIRRVLDSR